MTSTGALSGCHLPVAVGPDRYLRRSGIRVTTRWLRFSEAANDPP